MNLTLIVILALVAVALLLFLSGLRIVHEHERGTIFRLGRYDRVNSPGLRFILPLGIERMVRVDARTGLTDLPVLEMTTADNVSVRVTASMHSQVLNPQLALTKVADYTDATLQIAQTALRSVVSRVTLHTLLTGRTFVNETVQRIVDDETEPWGVKVSLLELKEINLPVATSQPAGTGQPPAGETAANSEQARAAAGQAPGGAGSRGSAMVVLPLAQELIQPLLEIQAKLARTGGASSPRGEDSPATSDPSPLPPVLPA